MIELENRIKLQCSSCIHKQVCGHKDKWEDYVEEHIQLRKKYDLFDEDPSCKYYMLDEKEIKRGVRVKNNPVNDVWTKRVKDNPWKICIDDINPDMAKELGLL
ncbi:MAG: hypothetical protein ACRC7N_13495 [Clostridium sp.]